MCPEVIDRLGDAGVATINLAVDSVEDRKELPKALEPIPLGRIGQPRDIGPAAVFLASTDSAWITGETPVVASGLR